MKLEDVMSHLVLTVSAGSTATDAARTMHQHNIGVLPVVSHGHMVGIIVTDRDIVVRGVAAGKDPNGLAGIKGGWRVLRLDCCQEGATMKRGG